MTAAEHRAAIRAAIPPTTDLRARLEAERHRRAIAQAQAAGLTALRDAYTANA